MSNISDYGAIRARGFGRSQATKRIAHREFLKRVKDGHRVLVAPCANPEIWALQLESHGFDASYEPVHQRTDDTGFDWELRMPCLIEGLVTLDVIGYVFYRNDIKSK